MNADEDLDLSAGPAIDEPAIPPTSDPSGGIPVAPPAQPAAPRRANRGVAAIIALVLFAAGIGIGWLFTGADEPASTPEVAETPGSGPVLTEVSDEPIADVAEVLLPSIVQLERPGGVGSGVVYSADGKILTAAHVVEGTSEVIVRLSDGRRLTGRVMGADPSNDIAVVTVDASDLPVAALALDDAPRVGQVAIALGSPWGLESTVTAGIVSAVDRPLFDGDGPRAMLQTDAPINPGNSGGALADIRGRVIGINVSIFSETGSNDGVGFAVPISRAYRVAEAILEGRPFVAGFLGVEIERPAGGEAGAVVTSVQPGSAADLAGIRVGDIIVAVAGRPVSDQLDLGAQIRGRAAGDVVEVDLLRDGETVSVTATLGSR